MLVNGHHWKEHQLRKLPVSLILVLVKGSNKSNNYVKGSNNSCLRRTLLGHQLKVVTLVRTLTVL